MCTGYYKILLTIEFLSAVPVFILLFFVDAPYGKFFKRGWGPSVSPRAGWMIMELPAAVIPALCFLLSGLWSSAISLFLILLWELHYLRRTFIYSFRLNKNSHRMPLAIPLLAFGFNLMNGTVIGCGIFGSPGYSWDSGLVQWIHIVPGTLLFFTGMIINIKSDSILRNIRGEGESVYKIPDKGLFRYVSSPHYFGEILEWTGWAVITLSPASAAFLVFTTANLLPRAIQNHKWYRSYFREYPTDRKALIPFIL